MSCQNPSGIVQLILYKLLDEHWGHPGYLDWLINLRLQYTNRRNILVHACEKFLPGEIATWTAPAAGMFHWIEVDWRRHPKALSGDQNHDAIEEAIFKAAIDKGTLISRGSWFRGSTSYPQDKMFFRATFAAATEGNIQEAISRFADALKGEFNL